MEDLQKYYKLHQITNQELFLDYKETYLILQRVLLKFKMYKEMEDIGDDYKQVKESFQKKDKDSLWDD